MHIVRQVEELRSLIGERRRLGQRIGLVPTMGNLHAGHYSLVAIARERCDFVVTSVFVNPTQFGPNEDFARYPRTPEQDAKGLEEHRCDLLFLPSVEAMYPLGADDGVRVSVSGLGDMLEGASRPGHFDGVATVVAKLFNLVQPDLAVFGRKDYQQLLVIRRMAIDLGFPVEIVGAPIVREASGLAMSSRNQYLDTQQREQAAAIHASLQWMRDRVTSTQEPLSAIEIGVAEQLMRAGFTTDYALLRRADNLAEPVPGQRDGLVALIAARLGAVRLIDNLEIGQ
jgi:pantoate--beta-alanine ligase